MVSLADLAKLTPERALKVIDQLSDDEAEQLLHSWPFNARPEQLAPEQAWRYWVALAGRGWGKTRCGAEWVREKVNTGAMRIGLIAPTAADARDTMVEGESGVLAVCWDHDPHGRPIYEPSKRRLTWKNGARATLFSADEPERLRGPQHELIWCDELAAWRRCRQTWDMAMMGLRLGKNPQVLITTTPKPITVLREILEKPGCIVTGGSTFENLANLADAFIDEVVKPYEGTRLGRQELFAELLTESEGALWSRDMLDKCRQPAPDELARIVVGVDPAISSNKDSNETGIVTAGREAGKNGHGYVLADASGVMSPAEWGKKAVDCYHDFEADAIVAEVNQGGEMVKHTIHTVDPTVNVIMVRASKGKQARAEPVSALYEQGRIHHSGPFPEMDDQLCTWEPLSGDASPDRLDALVWALTALFLKAKKKRRLGSAPSTVKH